MDHTEPPLCGVTRPHTLGYQHCILAKDHATNHRAQDGLSWAVGDLTGQTFREEHTLTVFNAVDVPYEIQAQVMRLLGPYDPDIYERPADAQGRAL